MGWFLLTAFLTLRASDPPSVRRALAVQYDTAGRQARNLGVDLGAYIISETVSKNRKHRPESYYWMDPKATVGECIAQWRMVEMLLRTVRDGEGSGATAPVAWANSMLTQLS